MKRNILTTLMGLLATFAMLADAPVSMTITLRNGTVVSYDAANLDAITYVGGPWGTTGAIGMKIYPAGSTTSIDYLYSQIASLVTSVTVTTPTISPGSGELTGSTAVTITGPGGTTIYYTTDGSDPTSSATRQSSASPATVTISTACTLRAVSAFGANVSSEATATYTIAAVYDNNVNRNKGTNLTNCSESWRLEFPHLNETRQCEWTTKYSDDMITFSLEWDDQLIANRWTCYQMYSKIMTQNVTRNDAFKEDPDIKSAYRSTLSDYSSSGFSRGHLCPSSDRLYSRNQNSQTFYLSNMQPQYSNHNSGIWNTFEQRLRTWASNCDTLYVVKAATIDDVTLNGTTSSGLLSVLCNNRLPVPKYFYMALMKYTKSTNTYSAIGIWTTHQSASESFTSVAAKAITIDELERRTGIDFFCNLPDDVEATVEASYNISDWP